MTSRSLFIFLLAVMSHNANAAVLEKPGQGFTCSFQTGLGTFESLTLWYGQMGRTNVKTPQIVDTAKIFVRGGMAEGSRMTLWVSDEWPDKFTVNYFDPARKSDLPSSLLTIFSRSNDGKLVLADLNHFESKAENTSQDGKITPSKNYRGLCDVTLDITLSAFKNGVPQ